MRHYLVNDLFFLLEIVEQLDFGSKTNQPLVNIEST